MHYRVGVEEAVGALPRHQQAEVEGPSGSGLD